MSKKSDTFATDYEEPTALANSHFSEIDTDDDYDDDPVGALAFTDFSKPMPILEGEDAERFIRMMEESERKAAERAKQPPTKKEVEQQLGFEKIMLDFKENEIKEIKE